nr:translation initiation factor IF-2-like [Gorilla gorilla gorilla]
MFEYVGATEKIAPAPPGGSPRPEGGIERGVGGPHAPHPQPRPGGGERAGRLESPSQSALGRRNLPQAPGPGVQGPLSCQGPGRCGPQRRGRGLSRGRSCKQPQRPGLASKSRASQAQPRAAPAPSLPRGRRARGPGHRRRVGSPSRRAPGARGAAPGAEKGEVRTYLSLLSTPSWIHLSTSPQSIMAALPGSPRAAGVAFRAAQTSSAPAARRGASALGNRPGAVERRELGGRRVPESTSVEARFKKKN